MQTATVGDSDIQEGFLMALNWEECRKTLLQGIALIGMNLLAFFYDAQYVPAVILADAVILGVQVGVYYNGKRQSAQNEGS